MAMKTRINIITILIILIYIGPANASGGLSIDPRGDYFLQRTTGDTYNCGPLAALIARQYADKEFNPTSIRNEVSEARDLLRSYKNKATDSDVKGWWELRDIQIYLRFMGVRTKYHKLDRGRNPINKIQQLIADKKMLIINVNMNDIPYGKSTGKPYSTFYIPGGWGHYLAIVGFEKKNDELYFEIHDSYSPKGKNRLYPAKQIIRSMRRFAPVYLAINQGV